MAGNERKLIALSLKWYDIRIHQGVLNFAARNGWDVIASPHMPLAIDVPEADGQIVQIAPNDPRRARRVGESDKPTVALGRWGEHAGVPRVVPDNVACGRIAAEEFLDRGFQHFAVFSTQPHWYVDERRAGFRDRVAENGHACEKWHLPMTDQEKGTFTAGSPAGERFAEWLTKAPRPLALYCIEDEGAAILMRVCHRIGLKVPEQIAMIGTNNDPVVCPYTEIPLSSVDLNWEGVGHAAALRLDRLFRDEDAASTTLVAPSGLVKRRSSDVRAVEDLRVALALSYIEANSHRHVTVAEITADSGTPLRTLQWAFKKALGGSIQDEITNSRLARVEGLLLHSDKKIGRIAEELGFSSAQYMNHFFTKTKGVTPNEFRQRNQSRKPS